MRNANLTGTDLAAIGVTNQRETTIVWDPTTGRPWYNAIVWQDTRTDRIVNALSEAQAQLIRTRTGLPPATYFSGAKIQWILDNVPGVREAAARGEAVFGNPDTWVIWNLTGGKDGGIHVTDVTNASRTMLMDLKTLEWDDELLAIFKIPRAMLPAIQASSDRQAFGVTRRDGPLGGEVPVAGDLGDQQAATVGQVCIRPGEAKNTYGTGNFMLLNTGTQIVPSKAGPADDASAIAWAARPSSRSKDRSRSPAPRSSGCAISSGSSRSASEIEALANVGARQRRHLFRPGLLGTVRAVLAVRRARRDRRPLALQYQGAPRARHARSDLLPDARRARRDGRRTRASASNVLKVDGGATVNDTLMQLQADVLGVPVVRPVVAETTALGAAYAAGLAVGFWKDLDDLCATTGDGQALGAALERGPARRGLRRLAEGRRAHAQLDLIGARCSVLGARCSVLGARCSVLGARCSTQKVT